MYEIGCWYAQGSLMAFQQYTENPDNYEDEAFMMMV